MIVRRRLGGKKGRPAGRGGGGGEISRGGDCNAATMSVRIQAEG